MYELKSFLLNMQQRCSMANCSLHSGRFQFHFGEFVQFRSINYDETVLEMKEIVVDWGHGNQIMEFGKWKQKLNNRNLWFIMGIVTLFTFYLSPRNHLVKWCLWSTPQKHKHTHEQHDYHSNSPHHFRAIYTNKSPKKQFSILIERIVW